LGKNSLPAVYFVQIGQNHMIFIEIAQSQGHGTLVMHYVHQSNGPYTSVGMVPGLIAETIDAERYAEFIEIHGSERAI
jgi:hypothetical protein